MCTVASLKENFWEPSSGLKFKLPDNGNNSRGQVSVLLGRRFKCEPRQWHLLPFFGLGEASHILFMFVKPVWCQGRSPMSLKFCLLLLPSFVEEEEEKQLLTLQPWSTLPIWTGWKKEMCIIITKLGNGVVKVRDLLLYFPLALPWAG